MDVASKGQINTAQAKGLVACDYCQLVSLKPANYNPHKHSLKCPRCQAHLDSRVRGSISKTWALLIASMILYIPANTMPIMSYVTLGFPVDETIWQGIITFIEYDMWPVAMVVFVASIVVPILKLVVLTALLLTIQFKLKWRPSERTRLFHMVRFIGRWSMVDIFVIALVVALVQFGNIATISAGAGSLSFAAVVILTMIAAHTFDPRLIWDAADHKEQN